MNYGLLKNTFEATAQEKFRTYLSKLKYQKKPFEMEKKRNFNEFNCMKDIF